MPVESTRSVISSVMIPAPGTNSWSGAPIASRNVSIAVVMSERTDGPGRARRLLGGVAVVGVALSVSAGSVAAGGGPSDTPASGQASNLGVCSPYLGQLGVRPQVNELVRELGPFLPDGPYDSVGELYRQRAKDKPTGSAPEECLAR